MPRSETQLPPKPYAERERSHRRHKRPCRERQQGDGDDQLDIAERTLADTRAEACGERLGTVAELAECGGVAGQRVPVALATVGDEGEPRIEAFHAPGDPPDRVRRRRQRRRSEDADRAKLRLKGGQVRPHLGDRDGRGRNSLRGLIDGRAERRSSRGRAVEHIRSDLRHGRQPGDGRLGLVAEVTDAAIRPDQRAEPDRRDDEPDDSVDDERSAHPAQAPAQAEGPRLLDLHASHPTTSPTTVGTVGTSGASSAAHSTNETSPVSSRARSATNHSTESAMTARYQCPDPCLTSGKPAARTQVPRGGNRRTADPDLTRWQRRVGTGIGFAYA